MSAQRPAPVRRPPPVRPSGATIAPPKNKPSAFDILVFSAGMILLVGVAYVAYRTQVVGEPLEEALPFLFGKKDAEAGAVVHPESPDTMPEPGHSSSPARPAPAGPPARGADPDNTYFGRRQHGPSRPTESAPSN